MSITKDELTKIVPYLEDLEEFAFLLQEFTSIVRNKHYDYKNIEWLLQRYDKLMEKEFKPEPS